MKKRITQLFAALMLLSLLSVQALAADSSYVEYYSDGSYSVFTVETDNFAIARAAGTKSGTAQREHYSSAGELQWKVTLKATFSYNGSTSSCTSVDNVAVNIYDSDWSMLSKSSSKSGNTATANVTMGRAQLVGTAKVPITLTLTCDKNGNLS